MDSPTKNNISVRQTVVASKKEVLRSNFCGDMISTFISDNEICCGKRGGVVTLFCIVFAKVLLLEKKR